MAKFGGNINRPKDYVPPQGTGTAGYGSKWDEGDYEVNGITWAHKDEDGQPALKAQKDGRLTARYRFKVVGKENKSGPYATATLAEMSMIMRAFNKEAALQSVPSEKNAAGVRDFLVYCGDNINNSGNTTKIHINGQGFVAWVDGAYIEADKEFILRVNNIFSKNENGVPSWIHRNFGEGRSAQLIKIQLEIVAGSMGAETPWKGAMFTTDVPYGFIYNEETDEIAFKTDDNGKDDSAKAYAMRKFMYVYCPRALSEGLETDYPEDPNNAVPWMIRWSDPDILFKAEVKNSPGKNGGMWYNISWGKAEPVIEPLLSIIRSSDATGSSVTPVTPPVDTNTPEPKINTVKPQIKEPVTQLPINDEDTNNKAREVVHEVLNYLAGEEVFNAEQNLTDAGKRIANEYLRPLSVAGVIKQTKLTLVTFDEGKEILSGLLTLFEQGTEQHTIISKHYDALINSLLFGKVEETKEAAFDISGSEGWD